MSMLVGSRTTAMWAYYRRFVISHDIPPQGEKVNRILRSKLIQVDCQI